jgi:hypothetical protein
MGAPRVESSLGLIYLQSEQRHLGACATGPQVPVQL